MTRCNWYSCSHPRRQGNHSRKKQPLPHRRHRRVTKQQRLFSVQLVNHRLVSTVGRRTAERHALHELSLVALLNSGTMPFMRLYRFKQFKGRLLISCAFTVICSLNKRSGLEGYHFLIFAYLITCNSLNISNYSVSTFLIKFIAGLPSVLTYG